MTCFQTSELWKSSRTFRLLQWFTDDTDPECRSHIHKHFNSMRTTLPTHSTTCLESRWSRNGYHHHDAHSNGSKLSSSSETFIMIISYFLALSNYSPIFVIEAVISEFSSTIRFSGSYIITLLTFDLETLDGRHRGISLTFSTVRGESQLMAYGL